MPIIGKGFYFAMAFMASSIIAVFLGPSAALYIGHETGSVAMGGFAFLFGVCPSTGLAVFFLGRAVGK